jgi:peroxiredoxin
MIRHSLSGWGRSLVLLTAVGCQKAPPPEQAPSAVGEAALAPQAKLNEPTSKALANLPAPGADAVLAEIGAAAPAFELLDLEGKHVKLADFKGKVVVLEWFNPECPFVRAAHTKGSLVNTAERLQKQGVVYLAINSAAPGKQGHGAAVNHTGAQTFHLSHPILLDETGTVGKIYGATNTPHLFVINAEGILVYRGAVDNSPDGEGESPEGGKLVSYLEAAVASVLAGQPVSAAQTKAYGCSVKYGT